MSAMQAAQSEHGKVPIPDDTKLRQRRASDPEGSAWVSANAGSGKTYVLSRRVIRLLLAGTKPSKILCLTYTKAAAAAMSNKVFGELAKWAVMPDADLRAAIFGMENRPPPAWMLDKARRLFAEAIETPGGLKIQTIHAFCEAILHQFPLEADLPGRFDVLDDAGKADLLRQARLRVLIRATTQTETPLGRAFADIVRLSGEFGYGQTLSTMMAARADYVRWLQTAGTLEEAFNDLKRALGLLPEDTKAGLERDILNPPLFSAAYLVDLHAALAAGSSNDVKQARLLDIFLSDKPVEARIEAWRSVFFTQKGPRKAAKSVVTRAVVDRFPDLADKIAAEIDRLEPMFDRLTALDTFHHTVAVLRLGDAIISDYEAEKRSRGALDFDDLIERTVDLLDRQESAAWVQFKLDQGIDHILVDEAQDTSPAMWTIVERLSEEFFAGDGQRPINRTLFAVGDEKQSIYSFQGAAPDQFSQKRQAFRNRARNAELRFDDIQLTLSFRSTQAVLSAVDTVFAEGARAGVVARAEDYQPHQALRALAPGHVEVWPMLRDEAMPEPEDWTAPMDLATTTSSVMRLAGRVANEIKALIDGPELPGTGDKVRPKDILVLVRSRHGFVNAINRVLKDRDIPVAGADRLKLTDHIAVEDLIALGRVMLIADDDLSLATVLKSPLIGWDDAQLFEVAHGRDEGRIPLWTALAAKAETDPTARLAYDQLSAWRGRADQMPPYEFYARILGADGRRKRFIARLGSEADDVLDEFLAHALAQERGGAAGLAGFLAGLEFAEPTIKREMDEARDEVRVMTVHGAKGLEAAIVFLIDAGGAPVSANHQPRLVKLPIPDRDPPLEFALSWVRRSGERPAAVMQALADDKRRAEDEYRRLLYVAMTRAADRLYVCGYTKVQAPSPDCWHQTIERALVASGYVDERLGQDGSLEAYVWRSAALSPVATRQRDEPLASRAPLPDWLDRRAPPDPIVARLTPSTALEDIGLKAARATLDPAVTLSAARKPLEIELLRGTVVHKLLEVLPDLAPRERGRASAAYLSRAAADLDEAQRSAILEEVSAVLSDPDFAPLFRPGSRAEVPIVGMVATGDGREFAISGQIDRLAVDAENVLVLDYKTNRYPPREMPESYLVQMALYRHLLRTIFPGRRIRTAILWTAAPRVEEISAQMLDATAQKLSIW